MMDFTEFIKTHFRHFQIDQNNANTVNLLCLWANRSETFEDVRTARYFDKGVLISGNVGTGKTELMRILNFYLKYLKSHYAYQSSIVWKFSDEFKKSGHSCFDGHQEKNRYYDELALTDEKTGVPVNENVQHYGDKILIGERLIMLRYNAFKNYGFQTHFTTNCNPEMLEVIYGKRAFSRLMEMCNFLSLNGNDRRPTLRPTFHKNLNSPAQPPKKGITEEEVIEYKQRLNSGYKNFNETGVMPFSASADYVVLQMYGQQIATEDELDALHHTVIQQRRERLQSENHQGDSEPRRRVLLAQYSAGKTDEKEQLHIWAETKKYAVMIFYQNLKKNGQQKIFPEVN